MKVAEMVGGKIRIDPNACNNCGRCMGKCPFGAMEEYQEGFKILIGGRWGKKVAHGMALTKLFTSEEEVMDVIEKAILLFRDEGISGERFADCVHAAAELLSRCAETRPQSALVAALGNPDITPDALGSLTAGYTLVTRHMKEKLPRDFAAFSSLALCRTGVLGTSGIESAAHIRLLADSLHPELVIVVDALAGAESERLCRTVQFTNTGISPGSGVGNDRDELSEKSLGVPVVAVGMPTVIDAGRLGSGMGGMFVTPRNIDAVVRAAAKIIGYAINVAVHDICVEDIDMLL